MAKNCDLEAAALKLSDEEREILEREIDIAFENNNALKKLIQENKIARENIKFLRLSKKEELAVEKRNIDDLTKNIEERKVARDRMGEKRKDYDEAIKGLIAARKAMIAEKKALQGFIKNTTRNIVKKYIRGNPDSVRKALLLQKVADGELSFKDLYDPAYVTPHSISAVSLRMRNKVGDGLFPLVERARNSPDDPDSKEMRELHDTLVTRINNIAKGLGVLEKRGLGIKNRPFSIDHDLLRTRFFKQGAIRTLKEAAGARPILDETGFSQFKKDFRSALGDDQLDKMIDEAYKDSTVKPSISEAFDRYRQALIEGRKPRLNFSNPEFQTDEEYRYLVKEYSGGTYLDNLLAFSKNKINELATSEATGGYLTPKQFAVDEKITGKMAQYYRQLQDHRYGDLIGTSSTRHARMKILNAYGKLAVAVRPLSMFLSPMADPAIGAALSNMEREEFRIGSIPLEIMRSLRDTVKAPARLFKQGEVKEHINDASEIFKEYSEAAQNRLAIEDSPEGRRNLFDKTYGRISQGLINHFHAQDHGLRVMRMKDFSQYVNKYRDKSFEGLPDGYKQVLRSQYQITPEDWDAIKNVSRGTDDGFITSDKFRGKLANKVASIEMTEYRRAMPNDYPLAPALNAQLKITSPLLHRALTMFWGFAMRTTVYGFKNAYATKGAWGVASWLARISARGFVPSMVVSGLLTLAKTGSWDDTEKELFSARGVAEGLLGPLNRPLQLAIVALQPDAVGYGLSTPLVRDAWSVSRMALHGGQAVVNGDPAQAAGITLAEFMNLAIPLWSQTPLKTLAQ